MSKISEVFCYKKLIDKIPSVVHPIGESRCHYPKNDLCCFGSKFLWDNQRTDLNIRSVEGHRFRFFANSLMSFDTTPQESWISFMSFGVAKIVEGKMHFVPISKHDLSLEKQDQTGLLTIGLEKMFLTDGIEEQSVQRWFQTYRSTSEQESFCTLPEVTIPKSLKRQCLRFAHSSPYEELQVGEHQMFVLGPNGTNTIIIFEFVKTTTKIRKNKIRRNKIRKNKIRKNKIRRRRRREYSSKCCWNCYCSAL